MFLNALENGESWSVQVKPLTKQCVGSLRYPMLSLHKGTVPQCQDQFLFSLTSGGLHLHKQEQQLALGVRSQSLLTREKLAFALS